MCFRSRLALLALVPVLLAGAALAQGFGENKLLTLMPELRTMAAPEWLREGTRVTYESASATVPANRFYWYKDHNDNWHKADEPGPASAGFIQYQCLYRSATGAVGALDSYLLDINSGNLSPLSLGGQVDPAGAGACWANPAALARADRFQDRSTQVLKMPQPIGGHTYKGIRFHYVGETAVDDTVYDLDTGLLLFYQHVGLSADRRSTLLVQMTFAGRHQVELPADPAAPGWLGETEPLQYQGATVVQLPGSPVFPMPTQVQVRKTGGGARWGKYEVAQQAQGQLPGTKEIYCGAAGIGGEPWMSPALLRDLRAGQVLDQDPQLKVTTSVAQVTPGPGGAEMVVISQEGPGFRRLHGYDRATGRMLWLRSLQQVGAAVHDTQLQLVR